jgi:hypothetical protein
MREIIDATTYHLSLISNEELIDLTGKDMDSDYFRKSIEEIAAGEMGVTNV